MARGNHNGGPAPRGPVRCAIYTRTPALPVAGVLSIPDQRGACERYVQAHQILGWQALPERYDDAGESGLTLQRPGLTALLEDVKRGHAHAVVTHTLDRLTVLTMDLGFLAKTLRQHGTSIFTVLHDYETEPYRQRIKAELLQGRRRDGKA